MSTHKLETRENLPGCHAPDDFDADGLYPYPGEVEDAMPEGNWARWLASYLMETLLRFVAVLERDSSYANLPIYYVKGTQEHVAPDAFFLAGVPYEVRRISYCLWETGIPPVVVFEILSKGSKHKDRVKNRQIYQELGVAEYYWFDPLTCELEALELDRSTGRYRERTPNAQGRHFSAALGLEVGNERDRIGLYRAGAYLPPSQELLAEAERLRAQEERWRFAAEAAREEAVTAREQAVVAREQAERRLAEERARREELERRVAELERRAAEPQARGPQPPAEPA